MRFRKKPVIIEAIELTKDNFLKLKIKKFCPSAIPQSGYRVIIPTLEGSMMASLGDWIIKGISGEFYPCKPDIFEKTYEKVID